MDSAFSASARTVPLRVARQELVCRRHSAFSVMAWEALSQLLVIPLFLLLSVVAALH